MTRSKKTHWATLALIIGLLIFGSNIPLRRLIAEEKSKRELKVEVTDIKGKEGQLIIALFTTPKGFPDDFAKADLVEKIKLDKPSHTFTGLTKASYVVVVVHDRNSNGKADKNAIGIPNEPIGLSNHPKLGPPIPNFEKAKVDPSQSSSVSIKLIEIGR